MLNHFDTVFAFVAVMTGVSLIVTSLTQMMGALFGFRGRHLRWGIASLLENYMPELEGYGEALSHHLVNHPLVSDSVFSERTWVPLNRFSRVTHFLWHAWKHATVVRSEELVAIVANLSENVDRVMPAAKRAVAAIVPGKSAVEICELLLPEIREVARTPGLASHWARGASRYLKAFDSMTGSPATGAESDAKAQWVKEIERYFRAMVGVGMLAGRLQKPTSTPTPTPVEASKPAVEGAAVVQHPEVSTVAAGAGGAPSGASSGGGDVPRGPSLGGAWEQWFDGTMDRVSQRFSTNMRVWTVSFAVLVAFGGGLDALGLFNRLSADPEYRALIVAGVDGVAKRAGDLQTAGGAAAPAAAQQWERLESQMSELKGLVQADADLGIFSPENPFKVGTRGFFGRVASAILLSLGAPFWFNALRKMANLRPSLANKDEGGK